MKTPIVDFVTSYASSGAVRLHMPGHKGMSYLGCESLDITEIKGADVLYSADGIINESENNASELFGTAHTFYSTEGSTLAIKAMLALVKKAGSREYILAARNVHKAFIYACALLDLDVKWLYPKEFVNLCSCNISKKDVQNALENSELRPLAVYITSPDYLGNILDVKGISEVCKQYGVPLLVDNAHGAYLAFMSPSMHPITLGADMCCDSAHKTLPALTGAAYLHISKTAPKEYLDNARARLALFASTSPSYLILQSLDMCNKVLEESYPKRLLAAYEALSKLKARLIAAEIPVMDTEPMKLVINAAEFGCTGNWLADALRENEIECEFSDDYYTVCMFSPDNSISDYERVYDVLTAIEKRPKIQNLDTHPTVPLKAMTPRQAIFSESEILPAELSKGKILSSVSVSCPPAVPIAMCGEIIDENAVELFRKHGIENVCVVK